MATLRTQTTSLIKPPAGTPLQRSHPLAKGLLGAWLLNEGSGKQILDTAGGNIGTLESLQAGNNAVWGKTVIGPSIKITDPDQFVTLGQASKIFRVPSDRLISEFSIVHCFKRNGPNNVANWAFGTRIDTTTVASSIAVAIPGIDGSVLFQVGGTDGSVNQQKSDPGIDTNFDIWVFTNSLARGMEIWQNGHLTNVSTAAPSGAFYGGSDKNPAWTSSAASLVLGDPYTESGSNATSAALGEHLFLYVYDYALSPDIIPTISSDPFGMYRSSLLLSLPAQGLRYQGAGGAVASGIANLSTNLTATGGIRGAGVAAVATLPNATIASGGIVGAGTAICLRVKIETATGGIVAAGSAVVGIQPYTSGGAVVGGEIFVSSYEDFEGNGPLLLAGSGTNFCTLSDLTTGGSRAAGTADIQTTYITQGGIVGSGIAEKAPGSTSATATGGCVVGGEIFVSSFGTVIIEAAGVTASGRAIQRRVGTINNVHVGYALTMQSDNKVKTALATRNVPNQLIQPVGAAITVTEEIIRHESTGGWCDVGDCRDGVLPTVTVKAQGEYLPPKKPVVQARHRQAATLN